MKGKRVLVTGGASFIGSHLVDTLLKKGADVRVADDYEEGFKKTIDWYFTNHNIKAVGANLGKMLLER